MNHPTPGIPDGSAAIIVVPDTPRVAMAEALAKHRLLEPLRALVSKRPPPHLLPTSRDEASVALATDLRIPVVSYETGVPNLRTLRAVAEMNTKSGFRTVAHSLGLRLPHGRACTGADLGRATGALLDAHERVVAKPDRSAGGHGLHFVTRGERTAQPPPPPYGHSLVEGNGPFCGFWERSGGARRRRTSALLVVASKQPLPQPDRQCCLTAVSLAPSRAGAGRPGHPSARPGGHTPGSGAMFRTGASGNPVVGSSRMTVASARHLSPEKRPRSRRRTPCRPDPTANASVSTSM
ncbi:hypothetical protein ABT025_20865 [Streptomyces sp. NPDC002809]|uniref:preATP grasp domain-containing protein n=1 Tax=Streptomyces sp. NPDC002809 TaxID=3154433 RepID=UPI003329AF35